MSHPFSQYIKIIGKGQKGARALTREEALDSMHMLLSNQVTGDQRGAYLMLLRTREETSEEVIGFLQACRSLLRPELAQLKADLDVGCYAGKRRQLPWYLLAVAALAQSGHRVFLHGAHEPGSGRLYASHVLPALGLEPIGSVADSARQLDTYGASYLDLGVVLPELDTLIKLREVFGLRSCANTLARLLNPSAARFSVQGVYHMHLDEKHRFVNEAFADYDSLCFRGDGGDPEVNSERPTDLFITRGGETQKIVLPEFTGSWAVKDKALDVNDMLEVWQGKASNKYGDQAIAATLTSYLMLAENMPVEAATKQAELVWQARNQNSLPFSPLG
ncbi:glycosyl transferase family protein [Alteromonas aestuariivivens]|uniref:Glycosyl transferase family protein n=1 Tax=Alteromonas aestuariivivens TaxID=1938339 RepID=A0A3D8MC81_9ALTE|nr:glycosyl transferase family protein [Alteromonas aestuariivivens]RDV28022.1 glycosyl transferase family protein [Alteromonas aestuariivivens]